MKSIIHVFIIVSNILGLLLSFPTTFVASTKSNADGYFCKGCAVVMEHTFLQIVEKMEFLEANTRAGQAKEVTMDFEEEIINSLNLVKPPFNINSPALSAAEASIKDILWLNKEIKHVNKWKNKQRKKYHSPKHGL